MKFLFTCLFLASAFFCKGQAPYNFYHLFLENGLSDARITDIVQDKYGFMWFATANGLNRFDGYTIKTYYSGKKNNGLPSNNIISLYASKKGELWVGTDVGVITFDFVTETFRHFDTSYKEGAEANKTAINDIEEDNRGNIYAATDIGVFKYSVAEKKWNNLNNVFTPKGKLRRVRRLKFFSDDLLFCATTGNIPIFKIDIKNNSCDSITDLTDTLPPNMYGMEKLNSREMLGGLLSNGFSKFNIETGQFVRGPGVMHKSDSIRYNTVYDILKDSRGRIWLATRYFRLAEYLPAEDRIVTFNADSFNPYGFDGNAALCVYEDRQHNIWVGTSSKGVYRFNPDDNAIKFHAAQERGSVFSLSNWDNNTLFIGSEKGPAFFNYTTGKTAAYNGSASMVTTGPKETVYSGMPDRNGMFFWMGTERLGLMRYDRSDGSFKNFSRISKPFKLDDDGINNMLQLPDGNLFLIGFGKPVIFNTASFEVTTARNDSANAVLKLTGITTLCYDDQQHIWLAASGGKLFEYDPATKTTTNRSSLLSSVPDLKAIYKITRQGDEFCLATNAGLILVKKDAKLRLFLTEKPDNVLLGIRGVLQDGDYVWFANSRRIGRLHPATGRVVYIGEKEGVSRMLLYPRTLIKSPQGTVLIGSNKGYYEIDPGRVKETGTMEAPVLTAFRIYDSLLRINEPFPALKTIRLKYSENFFSFDMSSFNYNVAEDVLYAYKLEGFDKDWQYLGKTRKGSYTNVPGGNYTLRLKAGNSSGQWKENAQPISIRIGRHFSDTWWFWTAAALALAGMVFFFYKRRINSINREARLRSNYEIKLNELENSALRTQMNPHFIFNSLNTINSFISRNETVQAHQYISKFSKLIRYILDHSRQRQILLSDELEVLNLYIQIERIRFENKFEYEINIASDIDASTVELPPLIIQPFVENAILHGLLPLAGNGLLQINIERRENTLLCTIQDNGIGREKAKAMNKNHLVKHRSHGIEITLKRIELFNKEHGNAGHVQISDVPAGGTKVEIPVAWEESF